MHNGAPEYSYDALQYSQSATSAQQYDLHLQAEIRAKLQHTGTGVVDGSSKIMEYPVQRTQGQYLDRSASLGRSKDSALYTNVSSHGDIVNEVEVESSGGHEAREHSRDDGLPLPTVSHHEMPTGVPSGNYYRPQGVMASKQKAREESDKDTSDDEERGSNCVEVLQEKFKGNKAMLAKLNAATDCFAAAGISRRDMDTYLKQLAKHIQSVPEDSVGPVEGAVPDSASEPVEEGESGEFRCELCERTYTSLNHLQRHQRTHIDRDDRPYVCNICSKSFLDMNKLKRHASTHSGEKPHECHICDKKVSRPEHLRRHLLTHSELRPFKCAQCDFSARRNDSVRSHIRSKHPDREVAVINMNEILGLRSAPAANPSPREGLDTPEVPRKKRARKKRVRKKLTLVATPPSSPRAESPPATSGKLKFRFKRTASDAELGSIMEDVAAVKEPPASPDVQETDTIGEASTGRDAERTPPAQARAEPEYSLLDYKQHKRVRLEAETTPPPTVKSESRTTYDEPGSFSKYEEPGSRVKYEDSGTRSKYETVVPEYPRGLEAHTALPGISSFDSKSLGYTKGYLSPGAQPPSQYLASPSHHTTSFVPPVLGQPLGPDSKYVSLPGGMDSHQYPALSGLPGLQCPAIAGQPYFMDNLRPDAQTRMYLSSLQKQGKM